MKANEKKEYEKPLLHAIEIAAQEILGTGTETYNPMPCS